MKYLGVTPTEAKFEPVLYTQERISLMIKIRLVSPLTNPVMKAEVR